MSDDDKFRCLGANLGSTGSDGLHMVYWEVFMKKYSLVGVDGNAFAIMGYTGRALKCTGHRDLVDKMYDEAMSGDYNHLICVCMRYIDIANGEDD